MGKLEDMRVERVDGVDRPATGHRWAIIKNEDGEAPVEKDYAGAATAVIDAIAKEESVTLSKETVAALTALAELLDIDVTFKSADEPVEPEAEVADATGTGIGDDEPLTKATLRDALIEVFASDDDEEVEKDEDDDEEVEKTEPKSRQPEEQDDLEVGQRMTRGRVRKGARPDFTDVIFQ